MSAPRSASTCRTPRRTLRAVAAGALAGLLVTWGVGGSSHADEPVDEAPESLNFGYSATAWSTPVHVEIYEPSLPIPATPQLEFMMAYSKAQTDGGTSAARASWFWPGDPVGEGLKTFAEQLGLPAQLFAGGYPVQVNAVSPSDEESVKDEPFPGMVMRAEASGDRVVGSTGFTPDGDVGEADDQGAKEAQKGSGNLFEALLGGLGSLAGSGGGAKAAPSVPGMPSGLGALVDFDGYVSTSSAKVAQGAITVSSRSTLGEVSLLGGLVKLHGIKAVATARSDGAEPAVKSRTTWGGMSVLGQEFTIGPEGVEMAGEKQGIPGLSNNPAKALEQLGVSITVPEQVRDVEGRKAVVESRGLQIEIKTDLLKPVLSALPLGQLAELVPDQAGPLKSVLGGLSGMAPRVVITLGEARSVLETVPPMDPIDEPTPDETPTETPEEPATDDVPTGDDTPVAEAPSDPGAPDSAAPESEETTAVADLPPSQNVAAGLPKLFSIPGIITLGALALAAVVGSWFRRIGAMALGAGGACAHGLDSGLPDLRKV